ncbi:hypothetical protein Tco_0438753, partial [Tanacetum coccineum]
MSHVLPLTLFGLVTGDCLSRSGYTSRGAVGAWPFWILSGVGLGPIAYYVARACGPVDTSLCPPRTRIVATVHLSLFPPFDESSIYTVTSVLTQRKLDHHCAVYNIPAELRPELPDRNAVIKVSSERKIGMYTRFIEFANYRIPLSKLLLCVLEYYQINLSQLSVIG